MFEDLHENNSSVIEARPAKVVETGQDGRQAEACALTHTQEHAPFRARTLDKRGGCTRPQNACTHRRTLTSQHFSSGRSDCAARRTDGQQQVSWQRRTFEAHWHTQRLGALCSRSWGFGRHVNYKKIVKNLQAMIQLWYRYKRLCKTWRLHFVLSTRKRRV